MRGDDTLSPSAAPISPERRHASNQDPGREPGSVAVNAAPTAVPDLAVIVPTFSERDNVTSLVSALAVALTGISWEVIFVDDDSPDGTADRVREIARTDARVRCLQRIGRRGLASACVEGMLATAAPFLAVIDGDLQHDERLLPRMLALLDSDDVDLVIGSRYGEGGSIGDWTKQRATISRIATRLSHLALKAHLSDPLSGFFMIRRDAFMASVRHLSGVGFKILLDLLASSPRPLRFRELGYAFRPRAAGDSKLCAAVAGEFLMMLMDKRIGHLVSARFAAFCLIGGLGTGVHLAVLSLLFAGLSLPFGVAQTLATVTAMTFNFFLNNAFTYFDQRLHGRDILRGWASFCAACGIGALTNIGFSSYLFAHHVHWSIAAIVGIFAAAIWNFATTRELTWRPSRNGQ